MSRLAAAFLTTQLVACSIETRQGEVGVYQAPQAAAGTPPALDPAPPTDPPLLFLTLTLRDFKRYDAADPTTNPAFENGNSEYGVVAPLLAEDRKPVYQPPAGGRTFGQALFDQWYRDVPGTNYAVVYPLPVVLAADGTFEYDSEKTGTLENHQGMDRRVFFPFDDGTPYATPFGNQGDRHNKLFTAELHALFTLEGPGSTFQARGDDDVYVFIDGQLVIDLGGTHGVKSAKVSIDDLGLNVGQQYALDLFYAERLGATADLLIKTDLALSSRLD